METRQASCMERRRSKISIVFQPSCVFGRRPPCHNRVKLCWMGWFRAMELKIIDLQAVSLAFKKLRWRPPLSTHQVMMLETIGGVALCVKSQ